MARGRVAVVFALHVTLFPHAFDCDGHRAIAGVPPASRSSVESRPIAEHVNSKLQFRFWFSQAALVARRIVRELTAAYRARFRVTRPTSGDERNLSAILA